MFFSRFSRSAKLGFAAITGAAASSFLTVSSASAALSAGETAMITVITTKMEDLIGAVASIATANLGLVAAIVVAALIVTFMRNAGR